MSRFKQERAAARMRYYFAVEADPYRSRARPRIDAAIRLPCVTEDLLVLLEPMVDLVPVEGEIEVIEVLRDAAGQLAEGFHLLRLGQPILGYSPLSYFGPGCG